MNAPNTSLRVITNSQMKCFRRCPREHQIEYVLGYRAKEEADALRFGSLIHVGLEALWRAVKAGMIGTAPLDAALEKMRASAVDDFEFVRASALLRGYHERWSADLEHYEVLSVEAELSAPLVNPETGASSRTYELGLKLDVVLRDRRDGRVKLMEHKSSSEDIGAGSDYWKRLAIDPQVSTYFAGGKAAGYEIEECIYDVLGKPALRPSAVPILDADGLKVVFDADGQRVRTKDGKKWRESADSAQGYVLKTRPETAGEFEARLIAHIAENPDRYYQRGTVVRLEAEEKDAAHDSWQTARSIREAELSGRWPRNPDACVRFGRTCTWFDVCTGTASLDDETRFRRATATHEELSGAA